MKEEHEKEIITIRLEKDEIIDKLRAEIQLISDEKNELKDSRFSLEETIQKQQDQINEQEIELQKQKDDIELRKLVQDEMSSNLLKHEDNSMMMSQKLTLMKN